MSNSKDCLFCKFAKDPSQTKVLEENEDFFVIPDKYPNAPVDLLIIPKKHISKEDLQAKEKSEFYTKIMHYTHNVAQKRDLFKEGYQIVANYSGYNHLDHEHLHILSGHH